MYSHAEFVLSSFPTPPFVLDVLISFGIHLCSVFVQEWRKTVKRMGRWIDFDNDYKTMDPSYMETVWWVFKQLFDKGLVYLGYKVMPYSTACSTPLSNFEANMDYREVSDPAGIF